MSNNISNIVKVYRCDHIAAKLTNDFAKDNAWLTLGVTKSGDLYWRGRFTGRHESYWRRYDPKDPIPEVYMAEVRKNLYGDIPISTTTELPKPVQNVAHTTDTNKAANYNITNKPIAHINIPDRIKLEMPPIDLKFINTPPPQGIVVDNLPKEIKIQPLPTPIYPTADGVKASYAQEFKTVQPTKNIYGEQEFKTSQVYGEYSKPAFNGEKWDYYALKQTPTQKTINNEVINEINNTANNVAEKLRLEKLRTEAIQRMAPSKSAREELKAISDNAKNAKRAKPPGFIVVHQDVGNLPPHKAEAFLERIKDYFVNSSQWKEFIEKYPNWNFIMLPQRDVNSYVEVYHEDDGHRTEVKSEIVEMVLEKEMPLLDTPELKMEALDHVKLMLGDPKTLKVHLTQEQLDYCYKHSLDIVHDFHERTRKYCITDSYIAQNKEFLFRGVLAHAKMMLGAALNLQQQDYPGTIDWYEDGKESLAVWKEHLCPYKWEEPEEKDAKAEFEELLDELE